MKSLLACFLVGCLINAANAQGLPRVIWVSPTAERDSGPFYSALRNGMRELGYFEGKNLDLSAKFATDLSEEASRKILAEAFELKPSLVVTQGSAGPIARRMNTTLPMVFGYSGDPVEAGLVESISRPGGNMTGISYLSNDLIGKRLEMLKELLPTAKRVAVVASPTHFGDGSERKTTQAAAIRLGLLLEYFEFRAGVKMPELLATIAKARSDAVLFFPTQNIMANRAIIAEWAEKNRVPTISGWAYFAEGGNVMSYGPNLSEASRRLATYVDRILKGARPADLPVEYPNRVEFVINMKAARAIGLTVPQSMLLRADRVIE